MRNLDGAALAAAPFSMPGTPGSGYHVMPMHVRTADMIRSASAIEALVRGLDDTTARRRPAPGKWCLAEILAHLHDEEREDFRVRLDFTLSRPGEPWPGIDPEGWVTERRYLERPLVRSLEGFLEERKQSVAWLEGLQNPDWEAAYTHPRAGALRAGDMLAAWMAHDLLHLRQITWTLFQILGEDAAPFATRYAGDWPGTA